MLFRVFPDSYVSKYSGSPEKIFPIEKSDMIPICFNENDGVL